MASKNPQQQRMTDMSEQAMATQLRLMNAQIPFLEAEQSLIPLKTDYQKTALPMGTAMLGKLPQYERMSFDNQNVKDIQQRLDANLDADAYEAASKEFDTSGGNKEFGSSYQATRQAKLASEYGKQKNQNAITALQAGAGLYNNDIQTGLALLGAFTGQGGSAQLSAPNLGGGGLGSMGGDSFGGGFSGGGSLSGLAGQFGGALGTAVAPKLMGGLSSLGGMASSVGGAIMGELGSLGGMAAGAGGALASGASAAVAGIGALL